MPSQVSSNGSVAGRSSAPRCEPDPDALLEYLERHAPELAEEVEQSAAGAGADFEDMVARALGVPVERLCELLEEEPGTGGRGEGDAEEPAGQEEEHSDGPAEDAARARELAEEGPRLPERAGEVAEITLRPGTWYAVQAEDLVEGEEEAWTRIARRFGLHPDVLVPFNQHVETVEVDGRLARAARTPVLAEGVELYIPSADEQAFAECRKRAASYAEAVQLYGELEAKGNIRVLRAARYRATGRRGESYGVLGVDGRGGGAGVFLSPNPELVGARRSRSEVLDGQREYRINWNATPDGFWKCSVFLHDTLFQAGFEPHLTANGHYLLAGRLHESDKVEEIDVHDAGPGSLWQRFGGRGSDESHNAVLTTFVTIRDSGPDTEQWSFHVLGAEDDRAADSARVYTVRKGTNETTTGDVLRFFRPRAESGSGR